MILHGESARRQRQRFWPVHRIFDRLTGSRARLRLPKSIGSVDSQDLTKVSLLRRSFSSLSPSIYPPLNNLTPPPRISASLLANEDTSYAFRGVNTTPERGFLHLAVRALPPSLFPGFAVLSKERALNRRSFVSIRQIYWPCSL